MSEANPKTFPQITGVSLALAKLSRSTWRQVAKMDDPEDSEELRRILIEAMEGIDAIEELALANPF